MQATLIEDEIDLVISSQYTDNSVVSVVLGRYVILIKSKLEILPFSVTVCEDWLVFGFGLVQSTVSFNVPPPDFSEGA